MSNEEKRMSKPEYFELREKRLKLVYKILYVIVAIWIASVIGLAGKNLTTETVPVYTFLLASTSHFIVKIIKYALMEFRCMKVVSSIDEAILKQTEDRYDNIWKSFSVILSLNGLLLIAHMAYPHIFWETVFSVVFLICTLYFAVMSVVELFKKKFSDKAVRIMDAIGLLVGVLTSYSICAIVCLVTVK